MRHARRSNLSRRTALRSLKARWRGGANARECRALRDGSLRPRCVWHCRGNAQRMGPRTALVSERISVSNVPLPRGRTPAFHPRRSGGMDVLRRVSRNGNGVRARRPARRAANDSNARLTPRRWSGAHCRTSPPRCSRRARCDHRRVGVVDGDASSSTRTPAPSPHSRGHDRRMYVVSIRVATSLRVRARRRLHVFKCPTRSSSRRFAAPNGHDTAPVSVRQGHPGLR